jgi:hypothetical protein
LCRTLEEHPSEKALYQIECIRVGVLSEPLARHREQWRSSEAVFLLLVAITTWFGSEFGEGGPPSAWFDQRIYGVPLHYGLFLGLVLLITPYLPRGVAASLSGRLRQIGVWPSVATAALVLAFALSLAIVRGVPELFADWRNLGVAAVTAIVASKWIAAQEWRRFVVTDIATMYGLLSLPYLVGYVLGGGSSLFGVRIPVFEGTSLYLGSFAAIVAIWNVLRPDERLGSLRTSVLRLAGISGALLVLLSFRRSFWLVWALGLVLVAFLHMRRQGGRPIRLFVAAALGFAVVLVTIAALGSEALLARLESFSPTATGQFTATNEDHVNDLVDAWSIVRQDPILGFGIGRHYETNLISDWKAESFEVHNSLIHVWLKFGVAGAVVYIWFHFALARASIQSRDLLPVGAFVVSQFAATMVGTWPYGRFQMAIFLGLLIAIIAVLRTDELSATVSPSYRTDRYSSMY